MLLPRLSLRKKSHDRLKPDAYTAYRYLKLAQCCLCYLQGRVSNVSWNLVTNALFLAPFLASCLVPCLAPCLAPFLAPPTVIYFLFACIFSYLKGLKYVHDNSCSPNKTIKSKGIISESWKAIVSIHLRGPNPTFLLVPFPNCLLSPDKGLIPAPVTNYTAILFGTTPISQDLYHISSSGKIT